jgi:hypothetical protein
MVLWRYDTQHNDIQHNDIQHYNIKHNDIQHNDIQHNNQQNVTLSIMAESCVILLSVIMPSSTNNPFMLNVTNNLFILSVVMLSVVAPFNHLLISLLSIVNL